MRTPGSDIEQLLAAEVTDSRHALLRLARETLPRYLVFGMEGFGERVSALLADSDENDTAVAPRNSAARKREKHLLLYLQRICAKNDTFSEFGPSAWGTVSKSALHLAFGCAPEIRARDGFLERWTAHALAAAINADPAARAELLPRVNPVGQVEEGRFVFTDTNESISLDEATAAVLAQCDGQTPVHSLGAESDVLERLVEQRLVICQMEVPALEAHAFATLLQDIRQWRPAAARERWLAIAEPISALADRFVVTTEPQERSAIMNEARERMRELGAARVPTQRSLYAASNPIGEECARECQVEITSSMAEQLAADAEPWFDLWRDTYAFVASRVAATLSSLLQTASTEGGTMPLPAFLRLCESQKMPLTSIGMVAPAAMAFAEIKAAFQAMIGNRASDSEIQLTHDDCHFVRRQFEYAKFDEYTYPSADLQISATSLEAAAGGDYEWIVSELHPPVALLHHAFYWSCPDCAALSHALETAACRKPGFHYGFFAADFTGHTAVQQMNAMPQLMTFAAAQRSNPAWRTVRPADAEVFVDDAGDVGLRRRGSREYLGSFARAWVIPLGFHPFHFSRAPHMPRLRCGKVIVQRRAWTITRDELPGKFTGVSGELVRAIEGLRANRELPRFVYVRPTEQALRRSGAEGRDKDTKPVFIDLESYLFLEIFQRWLNKSGELEVTEMLPDPEHLLWREGDGRRTFELRTLILPRT